MAIYHLSTKPISRSSGRTATASIAYRAGIAIQDERTGKSHDYTKRSGVVSTQLHTPNNLKIERNELWNLAEKTETRKNSRTAREIVVNLPHELSEPSRERLVNDFAKDLADKYGVAVDVAIHTPDKEGDNRNHHAHLMLTTRKLERLESGRIALTSKSQLEMSNTQLKERGLRSAKEELKAIREQWANIANERLEEAGIDARIDHRSHKDRGLDQLPTVKVGWEATALERKGIRTAKGEQNRAIKAYNATLEQIKGIREDIEIEIQQEQSNAQLRKAIDKATRAVARTGRNTAVTDKAIDKAQQTVDRAEQAIDRADRTSDRAKRAIDQADRAIVEHQRQLEQEQPTNQQPQSLEALKTELSVNEKRKLLKSFHQHTDQEAEKLLKAELKQLREQAKPQLDKINQLRDNKPFTLNPLKIKAWQQDIDKRVEQYNKIKAKHDQLKANGVTKEHRTQAMRDYYLERPEAYDTIVDIQKQLKEHDQQQQQREQEQQRVRVASRDNDKGMER